MHQNNFSLVTGKGGERDMYDGLEEQVLEGKNYQSVEREIS